MHIENIYIYSDMKHLKRPVNRREGVSKLRKATQQLGPNLGHSLLCCQGNMYSMGEMLVGDLWGSVQGLRSLWSLRPAS